MTAGQSRRAAWVAVPAMCLALDAVDVVPAGVAAQAPREIVCIRASGPVRVDGSADEEAWRDAPWTEPFVDIRGDAGPAPALATRAKLVWDDRYLYVHADMEEPDLWATLTGHDDIVWHENDFEVFLDPDGDGLDYFEVEVNALGVVLDLFMETPYWRGGRADLAWDLPGLEVGVRLRGTLNEPSDRDAGWSVEMAIPWAELTAPGAEAPGRPPAEGDVWRVNFSRVTWPLVVVDGGYAKATPDAIPGAVPDAAPDAAPGTHPERNWVWSPQGIIDMHRPERWGRVRFAGRAEGGS